MFDLPHSNFEGWKGWKVFSYNNHFNFRTNRKNQTRIAKYLHGQPNNDIPEMNLSFENLLLNLFLL